MKSKNLVAALSCAAALAYCGAASAQTAINWSGLYVGAHAGFASGDLRGHYNETGDDFPGDQTTAGGIFGLQGGYNWQFGRRVYGFEIDVTGGDISKSFLQGDIATPSTARFETTLLTSARFRSGIAIDNTLLFSSIGVGFGKSKLSVNDPNVGIFVTRNFDAPALVSGFGVDWRFAPHWSLRAEYLYYYFGKRHDLPALTSDSSDFDFFKLNGVHAIRIAANYHFNAAMPIMSAPAMNWRGWYGGIHVGYGRSEIPGMYDEFGDIGALDIDPVGFAGGLYAGRNWQMGAWVYGLEIDGTWTGMRDDRIDSEGDYQKLKTTAFGSVRARLGIAADNKLFYLTGGVGVVRSSFFVDEGGGVTASRSLTSWGPVIGSGLECAWRGNWSFRLEGLTYLLDHRISIAGLTPDSFPTDYLKQRNLYTVRAGLTYRFGGP